MTAPAATAGATTCPGSKAHTVDDVYGVLGNDAVLLPVPPGRKGCVMPGWPGVTLEQTRTPEYQANLRRHDIGVLLGKAGGGICTIDCDTDEAAAAILAANPTLAHTLRTRGERGCNFWLRVKGEVPKVCKLSAGSAQVGEWRGEGAATKIAGTHPNTGEPYQWQVPGPAVELAYEEIVWPEGWSGACIKSDFDRLVEKFGTPFGLEGSRLKINQTFFAGKFAFENRILYDPSEARFYLYNHDNGLWQHASEACIKKMVLADLRSFALAQTKDARERIELARTDDLAGSIMRVLLGQVECRGRFKGQRNVVHALNCMLKVSVGGVSVAPFSPEYYSRNQVPVAYSPGKECPRFLAELLQPVLSDDDILLLQKCFGGFLMGGNIAQTLLIQEGPGGTGKGTVAKIVEKVIGQANVFQLRADKLLDRFELGRYAGKRLLAGRDVPGDFLDKPGASVLKALTGGDHLEAEIKGSMEPPAISNCDVMITANSRLKVRLEGDVQAWRRRLLIIRYRDKPPGKPLQDFEAILFDEEAEGLLNWAITGAIALLQDLEVHGRIQLSDEQRERIEALLMESDGIRAYLSSCVLAGRGSDVTTEELCEGYFAHCLRLGWRPMSTREFERAVPDMVLEMYCVAKRNDVYRGGTARKGYRGIGLMVGGQRCAA